MPPGLFDAYVLCDQVKPDKSLPEEVIAAVVHFKR
jgi:hypothetical protein